MTDMKRRTLAKEIARDLRALGSVPFYFIVLVRAVIGQYAIFIWQLLIAAAGLLLMHRMKSKVDMRIASAIVLCTFTSVFYREAYFTIFATAVLLMLLVASAYIKVSRRSMMTGVIAGVGCSAIAYFLAPLIS